MAIGNVQRVMGRQVAGAVLLLLTLAGCSGSDDGADGTSAPSSSAPPTEPSVTSSVGPTDSPSTTTAVAVPPAKDGQNYSACNDGTCEVLIRSKAALNLSGDKFAATVANGTLKLTDSKGYISLSKDGGGASRSGGGSTGGVAGGLSAVSWRDEGRPEHVATLTYAEGDTVVVQLTTRK
jgi:hypothetical protein